jgi:hypothetical protein
MTKKRFKRPPQWFLIRTWQFLHRRVSHSDDRYPNVRRRWLRAMQRFNDHHFAERGLRYRRTTARFVNRYTAHRWM